MALGARAGLAGGPTAQAGGLRPGLSSGAQKLAGYKVRGLGLHSEGPGTKLSLSDDPEKMAYPDSGSEVLLLRDRPVLCGSSVNHNKTTIVHYTPKV